MVSQNELREIVRLTEVAADTKAKLDGLKAEVAKQVLAGDSVEQGTLKPVVSHVIRPSTSYSKVVERIKELHEDLVGAIASIERKFTTVSEFDKVEVKPTVN